MLTTVFRVKQEKTDYFPFSSRYYVLQTPQIDPKLKIIGLQGNTWLLCYRNNYVALEPRSKYSKSAQG